MRRMRFAWYHVLFILPALALAFGIQYQIRKNHQEPSSTELAVVKPSYFHVDSKTPATSAPGAATAVTAKAGAGAPAKASGASTTAVAGTPTAAGLKTRAAITAGAVPGAATTTGVVAGAATVERAARPAARFLQKLGELAAALPAGDGPVFEDLPSPNANVVVPQKKPSRKALAQAPAASAPAAQGQPAQSHEDAAVAPAPGAGRALAAAQGQMKMAKSAQVPVAPRTAAAAQPPVHAAMDPQEPRQAPIVETPSAVPTQPLVLAPAPEAPAQSFLTGADTPYSTQDQGRNICSSIEYRGEGPAAVPTQEEWAEFMATFHEVKRELAQWLQKNRGGLSAETVDAMQQRLSAVRAYRPPVLDEPDLAWRGIGVWSTADATTDPALRLSMGFLKLVKKQPARGKFELARLVAQTWSPCELQKLQAAQAWDPVLECLEVRESGACNVGTYSEAGWAVSSVVAATIAPPGCTLPALTRTDVVACLKKAPFAASASSGTVVMEAAGANRSVASEEPVTKGGQQ